MLYVHWSFVPFVHCATFVFSSVYLLFHIVTNSATVGKPSGLYIICLPATKVSELTVVPTAPAGVKRLIVFIALKAGSALPTTGAL